MLLKEGSIKKKSGFSFIASLYQTLDITLIPENGLHILKLQISIPCVICRTLEKNVDNGLLSTPTTLTVINFHIPLVLHFVGVIVRNF